MTYISELGNEFDTWIDEHRLALIELYPNP